MKDGDAPAVPLTLWALTRSLRAVADDAGFDDLRDALWLAQHLPRQGLARQASGGGTAQALSAAAGTGAVAGRTAIPPPADAGPAGLLHSDGGMRRVTVDDDPGPTGAGLYAGASGAPQRPGRGARRVRLPAPHPLPDALALGRALQPMTRRRPRGPAVLLDEEATAEAIAHTGLKAAVLRPRRDRWFELLLAVDSAPSMRAWRERIGEFELLLRRAGFRDLRRVALDSAAAGTAGPVPLRTRGGTQLTAPPLAAGGTAGGAESLLLVVSDAAAAAWHDGRVSALLGEWARTQPVALLQPLPPALWPHTAVGFAELKVHGTAPGEPSAKLAQQRPGWARGEPGLVLPVMAFGAVDVARWARMVMAAGSAWCPAALLPTVDDAPAGASPPTATALLESFRAAATTDALELAAAFATIRPLNLPVMRLIQAVMLPGAGQDALAQVLMSGLLTGPPAEAPDDETAPWEIDDAVRDELARHLTRSHWLLVSVAVQRFLEAETGVGFDFVAFIEDRLGLDQIAPSALPFAQLAARMADRFVRGRQAGAGRRVVHERVFAPGLTVQADSTVSTPVKRLAWSPSGRSLAVLHTAGAEVLSARGLARQRRQRLGAHVMLWAVKPGELELLRPLMDAVRDAAEAQWARPFVWRYVTTIESLADVSDASLRVLPLAGGWSAPELLALEAPALKALTVHLLTLRPQRDFKLKRSGRIEWTDGQGALDRPLASPQTRALAQALAERVDEGIMFRSLAGAGSVDAVVWSAAGGTEQLQVAGREHTLPGATTALYIEDALEHELQAPRHEDSVVAEYGGDTGAVVWQHGEQTLVDLANGVPPTEHDGLTLAARFSPDGSLVALIDGLGSVQTLVVGGPNVQSAA